MNIDWSIILNEINLNYYFWQIIKLNLGNIPFLLLFYVIAYKTIRLFNDDRITNLVLYIWGIAVLLA